MTGAPARPARRLAAANMAMEYGKDILNW